MSALRASMQCQVCMNMFTSPVNLPCGSTMCKHHVPENAAHFVCVCCGDEHVVPQGGFPRSKIAADLIRRGAGNITPSLNYQEATEAVNTLKEVLAKLKEKKYSTCTQVMGNYIDLRKSVLSHYKTLSDKLDSKFKAVAAKIEEKEENARRNCEEIENKRMKEMEEAKNQWRAWYRELKRLDLTGENLRKIRNDATETAERLKQQMRDLTQRFNSLSLIQDADAHEFLAFDLGTVRRL